ncbi:VENN motif pre-toxin domain-containing protein, partial [Gilliamella sp. B3468]
IASILYPNKSIDELNQDEKQQVSALAQLATGLAIAALGGDAQDINTAIAGGKNAVENNYLSKKQMHDYIEELQGCGSSGNPEQCAANVQNKYDKMDEEQSQGLVDACSTNPYSSACFNHIKNAVEGGSVLFTEADLNSLVGEAGNYSVAELCKGLPDSCSLILNNQDWKNQQDADYNLHNPILIEERGKDARYILGHIGIDTTYMSDKEAVDKVNEIGLMISAGIMGSGKGTEANKQINAGKKTIASSNPIINPATNKVVTEHIIVSSGKAPHTSTPNSIYEVSRADGSKSVTYYDANGRTFSREDYGQIHPHGQMGLGSDGRVVPHEHKITYNDKGFVTGRYYRKLSSNGKPIGDWIKEK